MSFDEERSDLRLIKTKKALNSALLSLLKHQNFKKITVKQICEEALISRVTFYVHYADKYDLLKNWLCNLSSIFIDCQNTYEKLEQTINSQFKTYETVIKNIIDSADKETLEIIFEFTLALLNFPSDKQLQEESPVKYTVLSNFLAGGMAYYILWHVKNKFSSDVMNVYLYELIQKFRDWETL